MTDRDKLADIVERECSRNNQIVSEAHILAVADEILDLLQPDAEPVVWMIDEPLPEDATGFFVSSYPDKFFCVPLHLRPGREPEAEPIGRMGADGSPEFFDLDLPAGTLFYAHPQPDSRARKLVDIQAEDPGLWMRAETACEAYLQQQLRALHVMVEMDVPDSREREALNNLLRDDDGMDTLPTRDGPWWTDGLHAEDAWTEGFDDGQRDMSAKVRAILGGTDEGE